MIYFWESDYDHYTEAHFTKLFIAKEIMSEPVLLKRFPKARNVLINIEADSPVCDFFYCGMLNFIVSERLKKFLQAENVEMEFFDVNVTRGGRDLENQRFYYGHLLCEIDCIDERKSDITIKEYTPPRGTVILDEARAGNAKMFYIKGLPRIYRRAVSADLREKLTAEGFSGFKLVPYLSKNES